MEYKNNIINIIKFNVKYIKIHTNRLVYVSVALLKVILYPKDCIFIFLT